MKKHFISKGTSAFLIVGALILGGTATLAVAMDRAQASADGEVISSNTVQLDTPVYSLPYSEADVTDYYDYDGPVTMDLMPIDLSLTKSDVPFLMEKLNSSEYLAAYLDDEVYVRVTNEAVIQVSFDNGITWADYATDSVASEEFALWLLGHDPIPGYSMREMQSRLKNGAEVKHLIFEAGAKEMYFVIDLNGVQIELVQLENAASVLVDGQRMMITSTQIPFIISDDMLNSFYDLLVSSSILTENETEKVNAEVMPWVEDDVRSAGD